jgi:hypothetical protein
MIIRTSTFLKASILGLVLATSVGCSTIIGQQYIKTDNAGLVTELKKFYKHQGVEYRIIANLTKPITLAKDGFTITSLGEDSVIKIINTQDDSLLSIYEQNGTVHYQYEKNGNINALSPNLIESTMIAVFNNTPLAAKARVTALYHYQSIASVVEQVKSTTNDETKSAYISFASLLEPLDKQAQAELIEVIESIGSDYTQAKSIREFLIGQKSLESSSWISLLTSTHKVVSDYNLSQLLQHIAPKVPNNEQVHAAYFNAAATIDSDYDKYRLMSVIALQPNTFQFADIVNASEDIGSDYNSYKLVSDIATKAKSQQDYSAIFNLIKNIDSDYDMQRALTSLPTKSMNKSQVAKAIKVASQHIGSDYNLANTLVHLAINTPFKSSLVAEFKQAMSGISSNTDKIKVYDVL